MTLTIEAEPDTLTMTVADGGGGLPVTSLRAGLGSTIVASLARQIGATVTSQSAPGNGTTIIVRLGLSVSGIGGQASPLEKAA